MKRTTAAIIGAGQCGLAMSHELTHAGIDHIIIERGQVANSWRNERWDSLRLLSPNWMNGLAGQPYSGADPEGFMHVTDLIESFDLCAAKLHAPVMTETSVLSVTGTDGQFVVQTDQEAISCERVVMANGACALPKLPAFTRDIPQQISVVTPKTYKRPQQLADGKVLVVGASASGLQLARELQLSGKQVVLAVGNHLRFPRRYRGIDISMWLDVLGTTSIPHTQVDDIDRVRRTPSLTLVADETIDLNDLQDIGVEITGRFAAMNDGQALFSGSLANHCAGADLKMNRLLASIDQWVEDQGLSYLVGQAERFVPTCVPIKPRLSIDLVREGFGTVLMATGFRPDFSWLDLPVFDRKGTLKHDGGVVGGGLYAMGLPYLRTRKSTFIDGAIGDAKALATHLSTGLKWPMVA